MSRLDELIQELCPDGVKYKKFGKIATILRGGSPRPINNFLTTDPDGINWIKIGDVNKGGKYITSTKEKIIKEGVAKSRYVKAGDFVLSNSMSFGRPYILKIDGCIHDGWLAISDFSDYFIPDFLYYLLASDSIQKVMAQKASNGTVQNLNADIVKSIEIPVPPLPVQQEIVRILDKFTALEAELEAELEAREKQYEYYRNALLSFGDDVPLVALGDVCNIGDGLHGTPQYSDNGIYYFINGNNLCNGQISIDSKTKRVDEDSYKKYGIQFTDKTIFMSINGTIGNMSFYNNENVVLGKSVAYFNIESYFLFPRYLYYYLQTDYSQNYYKNQLTGSTIQNLGLKALRKYKIPLPPLEEQERIVAILDRFDALVNDITQGLPAEIAARRKQYEYYRDKLLTFKEAVS